MKILDMKNRIHEVTFTLYNPALPLLGMNILCSPFTILKPKPRNYPGFPPQKSG